MTDSSYGWVIVKHSNGFWSPKWIVVYTVYLRAAAHCRRPLLRARAQQGDVPGVLRCFGERLNVWLRQQTSFGFVGKICFVCWSFRKGEMERNKQKEQKKDNIGNARTKRCGRNMFPERITFFERGCVLFTMLAILNSKT